MLVKQLFIKTQAYQEVSNKIKFNKDKSVMEKFSVFYYQKQRVGTIALFFENRNYSIGWSLCAEEDNFDKNKAVEVALNRAKSIEDILKIGAKEFLERIPAKYQSQAIENLAMLLKEVAYHSYKN